MCKKLYANFTNNCNYSKVIVKIRNNSFKDCVGET